MNEITLNGRRYTLAENSKVERYLKHVHTWELRNDRFGGPREKYCTSCCVSYVRYPDDDPYTDEDLRTQLYDEH